MIKKLGIITLLSIIILTRAGTADQGSEEPKTNKTGVYETFIFIRFSRPEKFDVSRSRLLSAHEKEYFRQSLERDKKNNEEESIKHSCHFSYEGSLSSETIS